MAKYVQCVCQDTLPWLISVSLDGTEPMSHATVFFENPEQLRDWFYRNAETATELVVGFVKTGTGCAGLTWPQAVDEALCVGWIDGVRHRIDDKRYKIRFTPRKPSSRWSAVNIRRVPELAALGRMKAAGLAAFRARTEVRSRTASYEQGNNVILSKAEMRAFKKNKAAWSFFESTPPSYRRKAMWLVISAKRAETRTRRLRQLISACSERKRLWD